MSVLASVLLGELRVVWSALSRTFTSGTVTCMSTLAERRRWHRRRSLTRPTPPLVMTLRATPRLYPDMRVRYSLPMAARDTDRAAWAAEVARLIHEEAAGNKSEFARLVGITYKTVNRWLSSQVDVDVASIFQIAEKLHRNPVPMLVKVGHLSSEYAPQPAAEPTDGDPVIDAILESDLPNRKKYALIQRINAQRAQQAEREWADVQWLIEQESA